MKAARSAQNLMGKRPVTTSTSILQRKCACGTYTFHGSECAGCKKNRIQARRQYGHQSVPGGAQPIASGELRSSDQQPESVKRIFLEPRFGHDFSQTPVSPLQSSRSSANGAIGGNQVVSPTPTTTLPETTTIPTAEAATETAPETAGSTPVAARLAWVQVKRHTHDALWYFCGEEPRYFSTTATLRATGYGDPDRLEWFITQGADKVYSLTGYTGAEITLKSTAGSVRADDVAVRVSDGLDPTAPSYTGRLTVRKPHRLIMRSIHNHGTCAPFLPACNPACGVYWTEIGYRVVDNVGGTIVGATVNENFPGTKTNDQPNNWVSPALFSTTPFWPNTNGTFIDNWTVWCGNPTPVAPTAANASQSVDRIPHEFYVGSRIPGRGCRVQTHTAHRYLGYTLHENITTPAP